MNDKKIGKYLRKKISIEEHLRKGIDSLYDAYLSEIKKHKDNLNEEKRREEDRKSFESYRSSSDRLRATAIREEQNLFDKMKAELREVYAKAPSRNQESYLQTLSLKTSINPSDVEAAVLAVRGSAIAESTLGDILQDKGVDGAELIRFGLNCSGLGEHLKSIDEFAAKRLTVINGFKKASAVGVISTCSPADAAFGAWLNPSATSAGFDKADAALERFGS